MEHDPVTTYLSRDCFEEPDLGENPAGDRRRREEFILELLRMGGTVHLAEPSRFAEEKRVARARRGA